MDPCCEYNYLKSQRRHLLGPGGGGGVWFGRETQNPYPYLGGFSENKYIFLGIFPKMGTHF